MKSQDQALSYNRSEEILTKVTNKKISYVNSTDAEAREGMREKATDDGLLTLHWNYMIVIEKDTHQIYLLELNL
jgi:hypothetical protein